MAGAHSLKIKLQVMCGDEIAMGPGKADLLEAIVQHGSISAAGRALGFSYRRAWLLVDALISALKSPAVQTLAGGATAVLLYGTAAVPAEIAAAVASNTVSPSPPPEGSASARSSAAANSITWRPEPR